MITTARLALIPATIPLARAELADRGEFARLLNAEVPANWPPESAADALPMFLEWFEAAPDRVGWFGWYALLRNPSPLPLLVASGGFLGAPTDGVAEIGYSVIPPHEGVGYATELVIALTRWAFSEPSVHLTSIAAETEGPNPASARVLSKAGFTPAGVAREPGGLRFERRREGERA